MYLLDEVLSLMWGIACCGKYYFAGLDSGFWNLDSGIWILNSGIWILDSPGDRGGREGREGGEGVVSPASLLDSQHGCIASPHAKKESGQTP